MKKIVIVCAGSHGKEVLFTINAINNKKKANGEAAEYEILGFIDDNPHALDNSGITVPIIGKISDWKPIGNEVYALGAAFGDAKVRISEILKERGCQFESLVAPWSMVADDVRMGEGCFITAYCISAGVELGDFVSVNGSMLCPGTLIDDFSTTTGFTVVDNARIGKRVFVGSHAVITPGITIGDDARISVGSIVTENVPSGATVFGVPAKRLA